jgi:phosphatidylglycerophosphatase A
LKAQQDVVAKPAVEWIAKSIATWFGCGYAPKGPGTVGSLAAIAIAWLLHRYAAFSALEFLDLALVLLLPGIWAAGVTARAHKTKDPQFVVVDEVIGQWLTLAGAGFYEFFRLNWKSFLLAFVLFRVFDIWKPWPIRKFERLPGGTGIVMDDVMAGVYGALVLSAAGWFNLY